MSQQKKKRASEDTRSITADLIWDQIKLEAVGHAQREAADIATSCHRRS